VKRCARRVLLIAMLAAVLVVALSGHHAAAEDRFPRTEWAHVSAAQPGWSVADLAQAEEWSREINSTAVMVIHHGAVVAEWGDTVNRTTELASVRKSLLSALIGIAAAQKKINLDGTLERLGSTTIRRP
jgi:CubicO group peptidase (beta-lactamase class C family)